MKENKVIIISRKHGMSTILPPHDFAWAWCFQETVQFQNGVRTIPHQKE